MTLKNPYWTAGTLEGKAYVERDADARLRKELSDNQRYVFLYGPRSSGTTSLITHCMDSLSPGQYCCTRVDLSKLPHTDYHTMVAALLETIANDTALDKSEILTEFPEDTILSWLGTFPQRLILFLDEVHTVGRLVFRDQLFGKLRYLFNVRGENPQFARVQVVMGGAVHPERLIPTNLATPFVGGGIPMPLLTAKQVEKLSWDLESAQVQIDSQLAPALFAQTGGVVQLCQLMLQSMWAEAQESRSNLGLADVERTVAKLVASAGVSPHFTTIYQAVTADAALLSAYLRYLHGESVDPGMLLDLSLTGICDLERPYSCPIYEQVFGPSGPLDLGLARLRHSQVTQKVSGDLLPSATTPEVDIELPREARREHSLVARLPLPPSVKTPPIEGLPEPPQPRSLPGVQSLPSLVLGDFAGGPRSLPSLPLDELADSPIALPSLATPSGVGGLDLSAVSSLSSVEVQALPEPPPPGSSLPLLPEPEPEPELPAAEPELEPDVAAESEPEAPPTVESASEPAEERTWVEDSLRGASTATASGQSLPIEPSPSEAQRSAATPPNHPVTASSAVTPPVQAVPQRSAITQPSQPVRPPTRSSLSQPSGPSAEEARASEVRSKLSGTAMLARELDSFCASFFPHVAQKFTAVMSRAEKTDLLLALVSTTEIAKRLREWSSRLELEPELGLHSGPVAPVPAANQSAELSAEVMQVMSDADLGEAPTVAQSAAAVVPAAPPLLATSAGLEIGVGLVLANRYFLTSEVGRGSVSIVWSAYDRIKDEQVALKLVVGPLAERPDVLEVFWRSAQQMAALSHPAIVGVLNKPREENEVHYVVMEFLPGGNLRQWVQGGKLTRGQILRVLQRLGAGLQYAHERRVIHRSIKPTSILFDSTGHARLTDFGLVWPSDLPQTTDQRTDRMIYVAPEEQLGGSGSSDPRADVYSLGMCALYALYGKELPTRVVQDRSSLIDQLDAAPALKTVLRRATAASPAERFASAAEFCRALEFDSPALPGVSVRSSLPIGPPPKSEPSPPMIRPAPTLPLTPTAMPSPAIPSAPLATPAPQLGAAQRLSATAPLAGLTSAPSPARGPIVLPGLPPPPRERDSGDIQPMPGRNPEYVIETERMRAVSATPLLQPDQLATSMLVPQPLQRRRWQPMAIAGLAALALLGGGFSYWYAGRSQPRGGPAGGTLLAQVEPPVRDPGAANRPLRIEALVDPADPAGPPKPPPPLYKPAEPPAKVVAAKQPPAVAPALPPPTTPVAPPTVGKPVAAPVAVAHNGLPPAKLPPIPAPALGPPAKPVAAAAAKPPVAAAKPPVAAAKPPVAAAKPPVAAAKPPVAAAKPPVAAAKPPVAAVAATKPPVKPPLLATAPPPPVKPPGIAAPRPVPPTPALTPRPKPLGSPTPVPAVAARPPVAAPAGQNASAEADAAIQAAQQAFVRGQHQQAISMAMQVTTRGGVDGLKAWRFVGGAACSIRSGQLATNAYNHLRDPEHRRLLVDLCRRNGLPFNGGQFSNPEE